MRILLYGEAHKKGSGAWCYKQSFNTRGHEVLVYNDYEEVDFFFNTIVGKIIRRLNFNRVPKQYLRRHQSGLIKQTSNGNVDLVIILKGLLLDSRTILSLKNISSLVININHDDFFSLNKNNVSKLLYSSIPHYDHIYVTRLANVGELENLNKDVSFFPFSYFPEVHKIHKLSDAEAQFYKTDILFIGTYERHRFLLLEMFVSRNPTVTVSIYGEGWSKVKKTSILRKCIKSESGLWMESMSKAIQAAKITLGFLRKENRDQYTQRTFEIPASGGCLLAEYSDYHLELYKDCFEALFFDPFDFTSFESKILNLLADDNIIMQLKINGKLKVESLNVTYNDRAIEIEHLFLSKRRVLY
jgi:hypothetical protein